MLAVRASGGNDRDTPLLRHLRTRRINLRNR